MCSQCHSATATNLCYDCRDATSYPTTNTGFFCSSCYFDYHRALPSPHNNCHQGENGVIKLLGDILKAEVSDDNEKLMSKVVSLSRSISTLGNAADTLQKDFNEIVSTIENGEKDIIDNMKRRSALLIERTTECHLNKMISILKHREDIALSVSSAMSVYKDIQESFSEDTLTFFTEIKRVKCALAEANKDLDFLSQRINCYFNNDSQKRISEMLDFNLDTRPILSAINGFGVSDTEVASSEEESSSKDSYAEALCQEMQPERSRFTFNDSGYPFYDHSDSFEEPAEQRRYESEEESDDDDEEEDDEEEEADSESLLIALQKMEISLGNKLAHPNT